jgi:hypothetical protein
MKTNRALLLSGISAVIVIAPLALLAVPSAIFSPDWQNLWMIGYARQSLLGGHGFPDVYVVASHVGVPQPIFYGPRLYPLLAMLSLPMGSQWAVRAACLIVWSLQFWLVYRLSRRVGADPVHAMAAGALMSWSIYPLTNLYNRGALAEFFATGLFLCGLCAGGLALLVPDHRGRFALLAALLGALALGAHAPTALIGGGLVMLILAPALLLHLPGQDIRMARRVMFTILLALLIAAILAPWIYALLRFSGRFSISVPNPFYNIAGRWQRFEWIDSWWARLSPLPGRWTPPQNAWRYTMHLDAQWNFPLALLAVYSAVRALVARPGVRAAPLMIVAAVIAAGLLVLSICQPLQNALTHPIGAAIQFPYRLVSHVNIALLVLLLAAWVAKPPAMRGSGAAILAIAMVLSAAGLALKLKYAADVMVRAQPQSASQFASLPPTFGGQDDYTLQVHETELPISLAWEPNSPLMVEAPSGGGPVEGAADVTLTLPATRWIVTSIMNFPWNRLVLDRQPIPFEQVHNLYFHETVLLPAGEHRIGYRFEPDPLWVQLDRLSWEILAALSVVCAAAFLVRHRV